MKRLSLVLLAALGATACGGKQEAPPPPILKLTAADEVLRVANLWTNVEPSQGLMDPPSKISRFSSNRKSELHVEKDKIIERLVIEEKVQVRNGPAITCNTQFEHQVGHQWGRRHGEAALEITRPALSAERGCDGLHPDGAIAEPARRALFVLRSDTLVAVEPKVDQRKYMAGSL